MCGIAGLLQTRQRRDTGTLKALAGQMTEVLIHRGPDAGGIWIDDDGRCALAHRRLSIIDTSTAGSQPFPSRDGRWWVTFNGEIYNFNDIRRRLEDKGHTFKSRSDTEVLVEAVAEWGVEAVKLFDGMFAFAAFDRQTGTLLVARDPFGEKPLYYTHLPDGAFAFASELRALEILPGFDRSISIDAVAEYLSFQYIGAPRTIYSNTHKLPPGCVMLLSPDAASKVERYYQFQPGRGVESKRALNDLTDELEDILTRSIERRLVADVPLGAFLSGGVDSSIVCALATQKLGVPLHTYSMGFHAAPESEHLVAREFAKHLGTKHHEEIVSPDVDGFLDIAGAVLDEPNGDTSCLPTYLLSRFARRDVTVAISGDGGDEMFGGYGRYMRALLERDVHSIGELPFWKAGRGYYGPSILIASEDQVADLLNCRPDGFIAHLRRLRGELDQQNPERLLAGLQRSDVENYLHGAVLAKVDRMSMQHSLEVRTPFLNVELANFAEKLPEQYCAGRSFSKRILRQLACRYLPKHLVNLPKQGFGLPMADWARNSLLPKAQALLSGDSILRRGVGSDSINRLLRIQSSSGGFSAYYLWSVVILEAWLRERNAELPDFVGQPQKAKGESSSRHKTVHWAVPVAQKVFCVTKHSAEEPPRIDIETLESDIDAKLMELRSEREKAPAQSHPIVLPLEDDNLEAGPQEFDGATLFFIDRNAAFLFGTKAYQNLQRLRVQRIIVPHRSGLAEFEDVEFSYRPAFSKWRDLAFLWWHRLGAFSEKKIAPVPGGVRPMSPVGEKMFHCGPISRIPFNSTAELTSNYAVFENGRQLLPLRMGFAEVDSLADGRYAVYHQVVALSKTDTASSRKPTYWVVPIDAKTSGRLPACPTFHKNSHSSEDGDFFSRFMAGISNASSEEPLKRGDRIVVLTHALPPGGAERQWVCLATTLKKMGMAVTFVVQNRLVGNDAHYLSVLRDADIEVVIACDLPYATEAARLAARLQPSMNEFSEATKLAQTVNALRLAKPRIVYAQLDEPNIVAAMAGLLCDVDRVVLSFRNYNPSNFDYFHRSWFLAAYRSVVASRKVVLTGNFSGANDDYAHWIGLSRDRIFTIPNAMDKEIFSPPTIAELSNLRAELDLPSGTPIVLGVFRLAKEKRPIDFVRVAQRIIAENGSVHFLLAGVGPFEEEIRKTISGSILENRFRILGRRSDVNVLMGISTLLLHTAGLEGMPNVIMEAMQSGLPVVATDAGGTRDLVSNERTGFMHEIGDVEGLAASCLRLLGDPKLAREMKEAASTDVSHKFAPERMATQYLSVTGLYVPAAKADVKQDSDVNLVV